jgi:hypothetical protein
MKTVKFSVSLQQKIKALVLAFFAAFIPMVIAWCKAGTFPVTWAQWEPSLITCSIPCLYLLYSWLETSEGGLKSIFKQEPITITGGGLDHNTQISLEQYAQENGMKYEDCLKRFNEDASFKMTIMSKTGSFGAKP